MLLIRKAQMEVIARGAHDGFVHRLVERIVTLYPESYGALGRGAAADFVQRTIERGARHGIDTEAGIFALAELMIQVGEQFERCPDKDWAQRILAHPTLPGELKIEALAARIGARTQGRIVERV